jgi:hypothetical protein
MYACNNYQIMTQGTCIYIFAYAICLLTPHQFGNNCRLTLLQVHWYWRWRAVWMDMYPMLFCEVAAPF